MKDKKQENNDSQRYENMAKFWDDKLPNLAAALRDPQLQVDLETIHNSRVIECDHCDGVGTVEGEKYLETTCEKCKGYGVIAKPQTFQ